jgi:hypothetical protein
MCSPLRLQASYVGIENRSSLPRVFDLASLYGQAALRGL